MVIFLLIFMLCVFFSSEAKQRVLILTDISEASREPDDIESMVRLLLYSNEMEIEGLIATSSCWRKSDPLRPDLIENIIEAYGNVRQNLLLHDSGYPEADALLRIVRSGNGHGMSAVGDGKTSDGSQLIEEVAGRQDERPVWICVWGGAATLAQTLYDVNKARSAEDIAAFISRLRVYDLSGQDDAGAWICHTFPDIFYVRSQVQWRGFSFRLDNLWTDSRGPDEELVSPSWFAGNIATDHGALGSMYAPAKYLHEGDTPTFLNLVKNGLSSEPDSIHFGGWGGRFFQKKSKNVRTGSDNATVVESVYDDYYMFTDATDRWTYGGEIFENSYCPVFRWRQACQNDFAARADWCVTSYADANHHPVVVVKGYEGSGNIEIRAEPGGSLGLDASESSDPDGDALNYTWNVYPEAGTYEGAVTLSSISGSETVVSLPDDCSGKSFHILLSVVDSGEPQLYRYRRIIITGQQPQKLLIHETGIGSYPTVATQRFLLNGQRVDKQCNGCMATCLRVERNEKKLVTNRRMRIP